MAPEETLGWLIDRAVAWELMARDLCASLSDAFASRPVIGDLWRQMSDDESHHAEICRSVRRALPPSRLSEAIGQQDRERARSIDALWVQVRARHLETLDDVYETAQELEGSEINTVFRFLALGLVGDSARREMLAAQLDEHMHRLDEFGASYNKTQRARVALEAADGDAP